MRPPPRPIQHNTFLETRVALERSPYRAIIMITAATREILIGDGSAHIRQWKIWFFVCVSVHFFYFRSHMEWWRWRWRWQWQRQQRPLEFEFQIGNVIKASHSRTSSMRKFCDFDHVWTIWNGSCSYLFRMPHRNRLWENVFRVSFVGARVGSISWLRICEIIFFSSSDKSSKWIQYRQLPTARISLPQCSIHLFIFRKIQIILFASWVAWVQVHRIPTTRFA